MILPELCLVPADFSTVRRKNCAMEVLMSLERQFATLRDKYVLDNFRL